MKSLYYYFKQLTTTFNPAPEEPASLVDSVKTHTHAFIPHTDTNIHTLLKMTKTSFMGLRITKNLDL